MRSPETIFPRFSRGLQLIYYDVKTREKLFWLLDAHFRPGTGRSVKKPLDTSNNPDIENFNCAATACAMATCYETLARTFLRSVRAGGVNVDCRATIRQHSLDCTGEEGEP